MTNEQERAVQTCIREAGGIVHGDGNIFFTNAELFHKAALSHLSDAQKKEGEALKVWRAECESAGAVVRNGEKFLLMPEAALTAIGAALEAWDTTVLPKAHDGMMQEKMEDLRAAVSTPSASAEAVPSEVLKQLIADFQKLKKRPDAGNFHAFETLLNIFAQDLACAALSSLPPATEHDNHLYVAAMRTLQNLGYHWEGGELWAPRVATPPTKQGQAEAVAWQQRTYYDEDERWGAWYDCQKPSDATLKREKNLGIKREYRALYAHPKADSTDGGKQS